MNLLKFINRGKSTGVGVVSGVVTLFAVALALAIAIPIIQSISITGNVNSATSYLEGQGYWVLASDSSLWDAGEFPLVTFALRPSLDYTRIVGNAKPTKVIRGVAQGFSFPIYASDDEELYFDCHVPTHYDEVSNILVHVHGWLDTANTDKNFQFALDWEHVSFTADVVPSTNNTVLIETDTGTVSQYQTFNIIFPIDYNIDGADIITSDDCLYFRLRRIAASVDEIAGEFVVCHIGVVFQRDKLGEVL